MAEDIDIKVRIKITLAQEHFTGRDHIGGSDANYELNHPVRIVFKDGGFHWYQDRDRAGKEESADRLPGHGLVSIDGSGDCILKTLAGDADVVVMEGFTAPASRQRGVARYKYKAKTVEVRKDSVIAPRGVGSWEIVRDTSSAPPTRYITSAWKFNTSAGKNAGILMVEGGSGTFTLTDPYHVDRRFAYVGGGPSADLGKLLKAIKALKDLVWVENTVKAVTRVGGSESTEDMYSTGFVVKNPIRMGGRELQAQDFIGQCMWLDAGLGVGGHGRGVMILMTQVETVARTPQPTAYIPMYGQIKAPLQVGAGACLGMITEG
jgi:hypothetical protein